MSKEINFRQAFISTQTTKNIQTSEFDEKNNADFRSIFEHFDENKDANLDAQEIQKIISSLDSDNDQKITKDEIKEFSKNNNFSTKALSNFLERVYEILPKVESANTQTGSTPETKEIFPGTIDLQFSLTTTRHGNYEKYSATSTGLSLSKEVNSSAIYDIKNDTFYPTNNKNNFKIVGFKEFFENKDSANPPKPKLIVTGENGKTSTIEISLPKRLSVTSNPDEYYKVLITDLTNAISELKPNVLKDLTDNIKNIEFTAIKNGNAAIRYNYQNTDKYKEDLLLNYPIAQLKETITHEAGHAVDANIKGWGTDKESSKISAFIKKLNNLPDFKGKNIYALENIREFYAEYYAYKNGGTPDINNSNEMFKLLENNPDKYGWTEIEGMLMKVRGNSDELTAQYIEEQEASANKEAEMLNHLAELNNKEDKNIQDLINSIPNEKLYDETYQNISSEELSRILGKYPSLKAQWDNCTSKIQYGEILKTLRNDSEFKEFFATTITNIDKKINSLLWTTTQH